MHVVIVLVPTNWRASEDQRGHLGGGGGRGGLDDANINKGKSRVAEPVEALL
jgi:hypothetical protein